MVVTKDKEIALQIRDNNPKIDPGKISTFGGAIEEGETEVQAAARELKEELTITVTLNELKKFGVYYRTVAQDGADGELHVFTVEHIEKNKLHLKEGAGIHYVASPNDIHNNKIVRIIKVMLTDYFKKHS